MSELKPTMEQAAMFVAYLRDSLEHPDGHINAWFAKHGPREWIREENRPDIATLLCAVVAALDDTPARKFWVGVERGAAEYDALPEERKGMLGTRGDTPARGKSRVPVCAYCGTRLEHGSWTVFDGKVQCEACETRFRAREARGESSCHGERPICGHPDCRECAEYCAEAVAPREARGEAGALPPVIEFLRGSGQLDGAWWGDPTPIGKRPYWWRSVLQREWDDLRARLDRALRDEIAKGNELTRIKYALGHHDDGGELPDIVRGLVAKLAAAERVRKNHAETLIGIASMDPSDGKRMRMWAKDGLSGYKEPVESTVLKLSDERNAVVQRAEAAERERDNLRSEFASCTDLANSAAREHSIAEACDETGLRALIYRLWDRLAAYRGERDDLVRQINEACAATECCSTLAEMRDTVIEGAHRLVKLERERDDWRSLYDAAMVASNAAGFVGVDAEDTIKWLADERDGHAKRIATLEAAALVAERRVEELTATLQKMAEGPCWFDGDENVEWDADERCSEEACFRCVAQHTLAAALAKEDAK